MTWSRISPAGFFYKAAWQSTLCNDTLPRTPTAYRACLKRKTLWLPGDSTSVQFWKFLQQYLNMSYTGDTSENHGPRIITDKESNFSVIWHAHELPFYHGRPVHNRTVNLAEHVILDNLPNATQDVIVLYLYVHFTLVHPDVFRRHVQKLVQSAKDLFARAPNVTLAVRGPHAFYKSVAVKRGLTSYWGLVYEDILHENFSTLRNKIVYLDFWDMTVAMESYNIHPNTHVIKNMVHNMMSFLCYRNLES
ncbi:NXPE family member 1-like [Haliotis cracherodii]|uniref:NXPE family member 1-like n=1 Tax=Haliotis cracherodii TaxID=6455 RepID=UPI0039EAB49F